MSADKTKVLLTPETVLARCTFTEYRKHDLTRISDLTFPPGTVYQTPEGPSAKDEETRAAFDAQGGLYPIRESVFRATYELALPVGPSAKEGERPAPAIDAAHLARQREFSERTFGPGRRTAGVIDHIRKELLEIEAEPLGLEWIDVVILALDGAWRAGYEPQAIIEAILAKQATNEARPWPDWRTSAPDRAIEHRRSGTFLDAEKLARLIHVTRGAALHRERWGEGGNPDTDGAACPACADAATAILAAAARQDWE
jgi:hypothetical protein